MNTAGENSLLYVTQYYNAFQYNHEDFAVHTHDDNVAELRLIMDFSSIETSAIETEADGLFTKPSRTNPKGGMPEAFLIKHNPRPEPDEKWDLGFEKNVPKNVFSVIKEDVPKNHTLKIEWQIDWKNLNKYNSALR